LSNADSIKDSLKGELLRKGIHLAGLAYIPFYIFTDRWTTFTVVAFLTLIAIFLEILRRKTEIFPKWILRGYERGGVGAYVYFGISMLPVTLLFSPQACFVAIACGSAGDGVAGIVKKIWKNIAPLSMLLSSLLVILFISAYIYISLPAAFLATIIAVIVETKLTKIGKYYINDNFSVPLVTAVVYEFATILYS
jgi:dolichol kinase